MHVILFVKLKSNKLKHSELKKKSDRKFSNAQPCI